MRDVNAPPLIADGIPTFKHIMQRLCQFRYRELVMKLFGNSGCLCINRSGSRA